MKFADGCQLLIDILPASSRGSARTGTDYESMESFASLSQEFLIADTPVRGVPSFAARGLEGLAVRTARHF